MNDDGPTSTKSGRREREHAHEQKRLRALLQYVATHSHLAGSRQRAAPVILVRQGPSSPRTGGRRRRTLAGWDEQPVATARSTGFASSTASRLEAPDSPGVAEARNDRTGGDRRMVDEVAELRNVVGRLRRELRHDDYPTAMTVTVAMTRSLSWNASTAHRATTGGDAQPRMAGCWCTSARHHLRCAIEIALWPDSTSVARAGTSLRRRACLTVSVCIGGKSASHRTATSRRRAGVAARTAPQ